MYHETRTTIDEVLRDVAKEVAAQANRVISNVSTWTAHPTYITRTEIRANYHRLLGAEELAGRVFGGFDRLPDDLRIHVAKARAAMNELRGKR